MATRRVLNLIALVTFSDMKPTVVTKTFRSPDGVYGIASISGVASRNGRVSSMSGVNFYPANNREGSIVLAKSGNKLPEPITFSKEENGKYTSGTIKIGPGSVSVSSIARSGFPADSSSTLKLDDDMFFSSIPSFHARSLNPWFPNNINFMQPFRYNTMRPSWAYPNYNPYFFNLWR